MRDQCDKYKKELEAARGDKVYCKGCSNVFEYWEIVDHVKHNNTCYFKHSPEEFVGLKSMANYRKNLINGTLMDQDKNLQKANREKLLKILKMEREANAEPSREEDEGVIPYEIYEQEEYDSIVDEDNL